jgi:hypothetical protein
MEDLSALGAPELETINAPVWTSTTVKLSELKPYEFNPRSITEAEVKRLAASIEKTGYHDIIIIDADYTVISGHQRLEVLKLAGYTKADVRIPDRKLTANEFQEVNISCNVSYGEWDHDMLGNVFELEDLAKWNPKEFAEFMQTDHVDDSERNPSDSQSYRFVIECEDADQLEDLKNKYKAKGDKIPYGQFVHYS